MASALLTRWRQPRTPTISILKLLSDLESYKKHVEGFQDSSCKLQEACGRLSKLKSICCSWDSPSSLVIELKTCSETCGIQNVNRHGVHTGSKNSIHLKESSNCNTIFCVHFFGQNSRKFNTSLMTNWCSVDELWEGNFPAWRRGAKKRKTLKMCKIIFLSPSISTLLRTSLHKTRAILFTVGKCDTSTW